MRALGFSAFITATLYSDALAQETARLFHHGHMWGGLHGWFMGPAMMLAVFVIAVVLVVLLVRWISDTGQRSDPPALSDAPALPVQPSPMDILKERLAKGEIDVKDYEARRKILETGSF